MITCKTSNCIILIQLSNNKINTLSLLMLIQTEDEYQELDIK